MTLHIMPTIFLTSLEALLDSGRRCHGFIGFLCSLEARGTQLGRVYRTDQAFSIGVNSLN